ncbi:MAG: hypothetical protein GQ477_05215 [Nanohaloarchaea archaeon]|nr:hypothetical protein [Candidatus Nanohaloarchaea archaeon]
MLIQMWADFRIVSKNLMPLENIPNLIAYGLKNNLFSKEQCKLIPLDHGDTLQTIVDMYGKNDSVESFRQKLIYPEPRCY